MIETIFSNSSQVQIQGDAVLRIIEAGVDKAIYELVGFEHYPVRIEDTRPFGVAALADYMEDHQAAAFAPKFNHPAQVTISKGPGSQMLIQLSETENENPDYMLWIAIGMQEEPPAYSFVFCENIPYQDNRTALLSLYERPKVTQPVFSQGTVVLHRPKDILNLERSDFAVQV